jgi:GTP cyclohydrolase IA
VSFASQHAGIREPGEPPVPLGGGDARLRPFDRQKLLGAVRQILEAVGEDPDREGLQDTPRRVADMYAELFRGLREDPGAHLESALFEESSYEGIVVIRDIGFSSMCEHHLIPFFGHVHLGYLPSDGRIVGLSKLARLVEGFARRPQVQERLTEQIAAEIERVLEPRGAAVIVEAQHLCMAMRGVCKPGTVTLTSSATGALAEPPAHAEALSLLGRSAGHQNGLGVRR